MPVEDSCRSGGSPRSRSPLFLTWMLYSNTAEQHLLSPPSKVARPARRGHQHFLSAVRIEVVRAVTIAHFATRRPWRGRSRPRSSSVGPRHRVTAAEVTALTATSPYAAPCAPPSTHARPGSRSAIGVVAPPESGRSARALQTRLGRQPVLGRSTRSRARLSR